MCVAHSVLSDKVVTSETGEIEQCEQMFKLWRQWVVDGTFRC